MNAWRRGDGWPPPTPTPVLANPVALAVWHACLTELAAIKPGNVGLHADGHDMRVEDFVASAACSAAPLADQHASVGERVLAATRATAEHVGCNTNLGIVLLAAPLAAAPYARGRTLRGRLRHVLRALTIADTRDVFAAIRMASPAGLGDSAEHDVRGAADADLLAVMSSARRRDQVARQYANDFRDVFTVGLPALERGSAAGHDEAWAATGVYLAYLARSPDTHICRKLGAPLAREVRRRAASLESRYLHAGQRSDVEAALLAVDGELKHRGINPGTSADLTVATLLARRLEASVLKNHSLDQEE